MLFGDYAFVYFIGQKKAPIPYDLKSIGGYTALTIILLALYYLLRVYIIHHSWIMMAIGTALIGIYLFVLTRRDLPLSALPIVGKYFKK